jgi:hypothetical protein
MYTSQVQAFTQLRGSEWIAKARLALRPPPAVPTESYLGTFALVGILGGVTAALVWLVLSPGP